MSTITFIIIINVVLCIAILAGQLWHYGRILRTPEAERGVAAGKPPATDPQSPS